MNIVVVIDVVVVGAIKLVLGRYGYNWCESVCMCVCMYVQYVCFTSPVLNFHSFKHNI